MDKQDKIVCEMLVDTLLSMFSDNTDDSIIIVMSYEGGEDAITRIRSHDEDLYDNLLCSALYNPLVRNTFLRLAAELQTEKAKKFIKKNEENNNL